MVRFNTIKAYRVSRVGPAITRKGKNMIPFSNTNWRPRAALVLAAFIAAGYGAAIASAGGPDADPGKDAKTSAPAKTAKSPEKAGKKKLTGAELYQINCGRCHPERYASEFTPAQWKTIVTHMRVRAGIPPQQAKAILKYLQEDSGNP